MRKHNLTMLQKQLLTANLSVESITSPVASEIARSSVSDLLPSTPASDVGLSDTNEKPHCKRNDGRNAANTTSDKAYLPGCSRLEALPLEILDNIIADNLYPSEIATMSQVSKHIHRACMSSDKWRKISKVVRLGRPKRRGSRKTYFGLVMATKSRICEVCYKYYLRRKMYEMPLPVFIESRKKSIRLCLPCRQKYYKHNPETDIDDSNRGYRHYYGGKIGVQVYHDHLAMCRAKKMNKVHDRRRSMLREAFETLGITETDESDPRIRHFILCGYYPLTKEEAISGIIHESPSDTRCRALVRRLSRHGINIFTYIDLYTEYLQVGVGKLDDIVSTVLEVNWLMKNTMYKRTDIRSTVFRSGLHRYHLRGNDSDDPILKALGEFIHRRVVNGQWNDIISRPDIVSRLPPKSLWQRIRNLTPEVWKKVAKNIFLPAGIEKCQDELFLLDLTDWDSFTKGRLVQVLDKGAISFGKRSLSHPIVFSLAMRDAIGEESFDTFVESNRKFFMEATSNLFFKKGTNE